MAYIGWCWFFGYWTLVLVNEHLKQKGVWRRK